MATQIQQQTARTSTLSFATSIFFSNLPISFAMDSFTAITAYIPFASSVAEEPQSQVEYERNGGAGNGYCTIAHSVEDKTPSQIDFERNGGAGNGYCTIA